MRNPLIALFSLLGIHASHHHPSLPQHHSAVAAMVERVEPATPFEPLIVSISERQSILPLPASAVEIDNIGDHEVMLSLKGRRFGLAGHSAVILHGVRSPVAAATAPGQIAMVRIFPAK